MKITKRKIGFLMLFLIFGGTYLMIKSSEADYEPALAALKKSGKLVDVTILGDIITLTGSTRTPFGKETQISYTDVITNKVVKRYVSRCKRIGERPTIGCMVDNDEPLKMLYVPGDDRIWTSCRRYEESSTNNDKFICSRSESIGGSYPPFTFDVERFR